MAEMPSIPRASFGASQTGQRGLPDVSNMVPTSLDLVVDSVVSRPLADLMASSAPRTAIGVVIELRSGHPEGVAGAAADVLGWLSGIAPKAAVRRGQSSVSNYVSAGLTASQIRQLVQADRKADVRSKDLSLGSTHDAAMAPTTAGSRPAPRYAIDRMWPNFEIHNLIHRSVVTTKSDAAQRAFEATGEGIVWAVLDSGIQADHPHFALHRNTDLPGQLKHMDFTDGSSDPLVDEAGHGTHVAGILAGEQVGEVGGSDVVPGGGLGTVGGAGGVGPRPRHGASDQVAVLQGAPWRRFW
jgi:serine protease AprX